MHDNVKFRKKRTQIDSLHSDLGIWLTDRDGIAHELRNHFLKMSRSSSPPNPDDYLKDLAPCISEAENIMLARMPNADEIRNTVFQMQPWTFPGPDGYPPECQKTWDVIGDNTVKMVQSFFHSKQLLKQTNHNFI